MFCPCGYHTKFGPRPKKGTSQMKDGFIKIAAGTPAVKVADTKHNTAAAVDIAKAARRAGAHILVLPEL